MRIQFIQGRVCKGKERKHSICLPLYIVINNNKQTNKKKELTELAFECYRAPSISFGVDSVFAFYHNVVSNRNFTGFEGNGLIVSSGYTASHVIPIIGNRYQVPGTKRISVGGFNATELMMKLLQLKYPQHRSILTMNKAQQLKEVHCYVPVDYCEELAKIQQNPSAPFNARTLQLPLPKVAESAPDVHQGESAFSGHGQTASSSSSSSSSFSSEQNLEKEQKKRDRIDRMKQMAAKKREEIGREQQKQYNELVEMKKLKQTDPGAFRVTLSPSPQSLQSTLLTSKNSSPPRTPSKSYSKCYWIINMQTRPNLKTLLYFWRKK